MLPECRLLYRGINKKLEIAELLKQNEPLLLKQAGKLRPSEFIILQGPIISRGTLVYQVGMTLVGVQVEDNR